MGELIVWAGIRRPSPARRSSVVVWLLWKLIVSIDLYWEEWKLEFLLSHCRYLDFFTEMFLEWSSTIHMYFVHIAEFDWLPWQHKG